MQESLEKNISVPKDSFEIFEELITDIKERTSFPKIPTGIKSLDNLIWGLHKKELLIIASRPSQGKTSLTLQIGWNIAKKNLKVLFSSLEMAAVSVFERLFCNEMTIHGWKLRKGDEREMERAMTLQDNFRSRLVLSPFHAVDNLGKTIQELESLVRNYKPEVLIIDHLQRISSVGYRNKQDALAEYVQFCKEIALRENLAVVLASQINRQGADQDNAFNFMKGTGEIEEGADTLLQCNWVGREDANLPLEKYRVSVLKQRHGPIDQAFLNFDVAYYRFKDWSEHEETY